MKTSAFSRLLTVGTALLFFLSVANIDLQASEQGKILPFGMPHFSYNKLSQIPSVRAINPTRVAGYQVKSALASLQYVTNEDPVTGGGGGGSGTTATTTSASYDLEIVSGEATSLGFKFNFCNNGDTIANFPVDIYVGPTVRTFDLIGLQTAHTCQSHTWTYGVWGLTNTAGNTYSVEVDIDLRHTIAETNENNNTMQMVLTVPSLATSPDLNIAELTVTMMDSSIPTSRRVYWRSTAAAGVGEYRYANSSSTLSLLPWRSDGVVDGTQTGNIFGSQLDLANLTPGATYYIEVRKWYSSSSGPVYGNSLSTSFTIANTSTNVCADTDGGFVPNNKGTACVGSNCVTDTCSTTMGAQFIHEYFCQGATRSSASESCGYGNICYQGACVKGDQTALPYQSRTTTCTDSDGGLNINVKGVTRGENYQGVYIEAYDKCTSATSDYGADTGDYVAEFYCMPNSGQSFATSNASSWVYPSYRNKCTYGCKDGRCLTASEVTPPSTVCAGPGLRADVYGGPNQVCCAGLVLQGGVCNVSVATSTTPLLDFEVTDIKVGSLQADAGPEVGFFVSIRNNGDTITRQWLADSLKSISGIVKDLTNSMGYGMVVDFICVGCSIDGSETFPHGSTYTAKGYLVQNSNGKYNLRATIDHENLFSETNENNNTLTKELSFKLGDEARSNEKVVVCHRNSANNYTVLKTSKDGWENGHRQHSGDFIKTGEGTCEAYASKNILVPDSGIQDDGPVNIPGLITTPQTLNQTTQDAKNELIQRLQLRIQKLERTVTALEQQVIQREVERETAIDRKLTNRLEGKLLLQTERKGEIWWVLPDVGQKIYLQNGDGAYEAMRTFGLGISENDFKNIDKIGNDHKGEVLLRVQAHGEAYYIDDKGTPHYLKDGNAAYEIMKDQALGINDRDLSKIPTGKFYTETTVSQ